MAGSEREKSNDGLPLPDGFGCYEQVVEDMGDDYFMRGTRLDIGAFSIVLVEIQHPNYGYFSDYMLWVSSLHSQSWTAFPLFRGTENLEVSDFVQKHPCFSSLFRPRDVWDFMDSL
ncbi:MAG: hypothetical protein ACP5EK_00060 [Thermoplasmatota archaeon]